MLKRFGRLILLLQEARKLQVSLKLLRPRLDALGQLKGMAAAANG